MRRDLRPSARPAPPVGAPSPPPVGAPRSPPVGAPSPPPVGAPGSEAGRGSGMRFAPSGSLTTPVSSGFPPGAVASSAAFSSASWASSSVPPRRITAASTEPEHPGAGRGHRGPVGHHLVAVAAGARTGDQVRQRQQRRTGQAGQRDGQRGHFPPPRRPAQHRTDQQRQRRHREQRRALGDRGGEESGVEDAEAYRGQRVAGRERRRDRDDREHPDRPAPNSGQAPARDLLGQRGVRGEQRRPARRGRRTCR